ncbi:bestrophin-4 isoform X2 [Brachyhypopomus gauderio]|uniref:bestrophin-4 isoform X2 n=1 Tax=Brachyhypopomus gauderio TaxID=698409 RepID=UPI004041ACAD
MTVTYSRRVADARLGTFSHLLLRWKGSIYKLLYRELLIFCSFYCCISVFYRFLLDDGQRRLFEKLAIYCDQYAQLIPVSFVLGFYVTLVVSRWWGQFESVPWPDRLAALVGGHVRGVDEGGRLMRRSLVRYANLSGILMYRSISTAVYKRFPSMQHLVQAGLMSAEELSQLEDLPSPHNKFWVPCMWFVSLALRARTEGRINNDVVLSAILNVAEQLINPFGEDDDDFETNWLVDRNLQVSLLSVDEMYDLVPVVKKDQYWNEAQPQPPYTAASAEHRKPSYMGSALDISVPKDEMEFQYNLEQIKEHEEANHSTPLLDGLSRLLGVQSPSFPLSAPPTRLSLLRRRPRAPLSRFPLYLHPEAPTMLGHDPNQPDMLECAFSSTALHERPGFYSCPQTPIHSVPPLVPRPRPPRRGQGELAQSASSLSHPPLGSQQLPPPDTPGQMPPPPLSAFPLVGEDGKHPSVPAFSFPDPVPELCPPPKSWQTQGLISQCPLPPCLSLSTPPPTEGHPGPPSACTGGAGGERVFSFTPPYRNLIQTSMSSGCINTNTTNSNNINSTANICNGTGQVSSSVNNLRVINRSTMTLTSSANALGLIATASQQPANQQNSPKDSGISLSEGDLLGGLVVQSGVVKASKMREQI